ncbi:MAG: AbrB/MazE/SpoVT family DNA-binding domain-containing protein [Proteobacteria bacterium]|nr:AbrB/MazE/SpoVT family DNA-binding domain-containing protein [Pseudomonadota bacterium]
MKAIVAERGQITIPKSLRQKLGVKPGTVLDFQIKGTTLVATKADQSDPIDRVYGCLKQKINTDEVIDSLRGKEEK